MPWADFWPLYAQVLILGVTIIVAIVGLIRFVIWMDS